MTNAAHLSFRVGLERTAEEKQQRPGLRRREAEGAELPLSYAQQSLWFMAQLVPDHPFYNLPSALRLRGPLDLEALRRTFAALVERHEALRTIFPIREGRPVQQVQPAQAPEVPLVKVSGEALEQRRTSAARLAAEESMRPFNLTDGPLLRVAVFEIDPEEHLLVFTMHHIVTDGWSIGVMSREIPLLYDAFRRREQPLLPPLPVQYGDYTLWQRERLSSGGLDASLNYWRERLSEVEALEFPVDRPRPAIQSHRGAVQFVALPRGLRDRLEALAHAEGVTLFMVLLAGFHLLLSRYSGKRQTLVGTPMANRELREVEGLIGFFANSLVLPCNLGGNPSFRALLGRVREETLRAYEHREVPFEVLVEQTRARRDPGRNPIFQVMFSLQKSSVGEIAFPGLDAQAVTLENNTTHFDMEWHLWNREDELGGYVSYNVDLFEPSTILRLAGHFTNLLEVAVQNPDQGIDRLDPILAWERDWLMSRAQGGAVDRFSSGASSARERGMDPLSALRARARRSEAVPLWRVAGEGPAAGMTAAAGCGAVGWLRARWASQLSAGECVLWQADATPEALTAALAAWSLGVTLVPVEPGTPAARLREIAHQRGAARMLCPAHVALPEGIEPIAVPDVLPASLASTEALPSPRAEQTALWLEVGGSWARLSHGGLSWRLEALEVEYGLAAGESAAHVGFAAPVALVESLVPLVVGATLVLPPRGESRTAQLASLLAASPAQLLLTPEGAGELLEGDNAPNLLLSRVGRLICTGAQPASQLFEDFDKRFGVKLRFVYTPPEALLPLSRRHGGGGTDAVGLALQGELNAGVTLVDSGGLAAPLGVVGRICLPQSFCLEFEHPPLVASPLQGELALIGTGDRGRFRADGSLELCGPVKGSLWWLGGRMDFPRTAQALLQHPSVAEAAILPRLSKVGWEPVAYLALHRPVARQALQEAGAFLLEPCRRPRSLVALSCLPRERQGGVDEHALGLLPVADDALAQRWQSTINAQVGVLGARVLLREAVNPAKPYHVSELLPDWKAEKTPTPGLAGQSAAEGSDAEEWKRRPRALALGGPLELPAGAPRTLIDALVRTARDYPERGVRCLQESGEEIYLRYPELLLRARRVLTGLRAAGLKPGDRVILQMDRLADHFACFWGCVLGGIVPVTVAIASTYEQRNSVVNKLWNVWTLLRGPCILHNESLGEALAGVPALYAHEGPAPFAFRMLRAEALRQYEPAEELYEARPRDLAFLQLTSGSTGVPKCIQETHDGIIHHIHGSARFNGYSADDVSLNWLPMDHVVPLLTCHLKDTYLGIQQIHVRTPVILADPLRWLDLMAQHRVTHTWSPNFGFKLVSDQLARSPDRHWDLSSLKFAMNAGEQVTLPVVSEWLRRLEPFGVKPRVMQPAFGMAEVCTCMTYQNDFSPETGVHWVEKSTLGGLLGEAQPGSREAIAFIDLGPVMPGVDIRIVDTDNQLLPEGVIGRFQIRGAVTTPGYLENDQANREAFVGDGWFNSGDLGFIKNGRLTLTGREKEIIIIRGANFYCYEVEDVVSAVEGVEPTFSAAVAVQDPATGSETLAIFFVPRHESLAPDASLILRIREAVGRELGISPGFVIPISRQEFPKTTSGKIQRTQLKKAFAAGAFDELLKRIDLLLGNANTIPSWFYRKQFRPESLPAGARVGEGTTLILADAEGLAEALVARLGGPCVLVEPGSAFEEVDAGRFRLDGRSADDYTRLVGILASRGQTPARILHLWHYNRQGADLELGLEIDHGLGAVLLLVQALSRGGLLEGRPLRLFSVARHSQAVAPNERLQPARAALQALLKTAAQEFPGLDVRHIDLDTAESSAQAARVVEELAAPVKDTEVVYRNGRRLVPRLTAVDFSARGGASLAPNGFYVITGGLGGVAGHLARYLLATFSARLLLLGRTSLADSPEQARLLRELQLGGQVAYAAVDVADADALRAAIDEQARSWGSPEGVFHLAGVFNTSPLGEIRPEALREELRAKVEGTLAIRGVVPDPALFVCFGSVNAFFGGATAGIYAAANRFLEAFVEAERASGLTSSSCIGWSMWDEVGMSRGYLMRDASKAQGFAIIESRKGLVSMRALLTAGASVTYVGLDATRPRVRSLLESASAPLHTLAAWYRAKSDFHPGGLDRLEVADRFGTLARCQFTRCEVLPLRANGTVDDDALLSQEVRGASAPEVQPRTSTERIIASIWREVLRLDQIDIQRSFFELGGQSILLVQVHHRLSQVLNQELTVVDLLRYPTVSTLARFLDSEHKEKPTYEKARERALKQKKAAQQRKPIRSPAR
jgi:acyl-CoA synthetase (AMP-forming)/AMP-acid ligase II